MSLLINGVAHRLAVDGEAFVLFSVGFVPALQGTVQMQRIDTDEDIADDVLAWNDIAALFTTASETLTRLGSKTIGPVRDGFVPAHPAQDCPCCNRQYVGKSVTSSLSTAGIGDIGEELG